MFPPAPSSSFVLLLFGHLLKEEDRGSLMIRGRNSRRNRGGGRERRGGRGRGRLRSNKRTHFRVGGHNDRFLVHQIQLFLSGDATKFAIPTPAAVPADTDNWLGRGRGEKRRRDRRGRRKRRGGRGKRSLRLRKGGRGRGGRARGRR
jgi:hypothetical protein